MPDPREILIADLRRKFNVPNNIQLMNALQDHGLVSDGCESIDQVPGCDLIRANNPTAPATSERTRPGAAAVGGRLFNTQEAGISPAV